MFSGSRFSLVNSYMQKTSSVTYFNEEECGVYSLFKFAWEITSPSFYRRLAFQSACCYRRLNRQHIGQKMSIRSVSSTPHSLQMPLISLELFFTTFR